MSTERYPHCKKCKKILEDCGCDGYQGSYYPDPTPVPEGLRREGDTAMIRGDERAIEEFREAQRLAEFLTSEFDRLGIPQARRIFAFSIMMAAWLLDADSTFTMLEQTSGRILTDDEKMQHFVDQTKELAELGRKQRQLEKEGNDGSAEPKKYH